MANDWEHPNIYLTAVEAEAFSRMKKTEASELAKFMIHYGFFFVPDNGPEPALTHFYEILYKVPSPEMYLAN